MSAGVDDDNGAVNDGVVVFPPNSDGDGVVALPNDEPKIGFGVSDVDDVTVVVFGPLAKANPPKSVDGVEAENKN